MNRIAFWAAFCIYEEPGKGSRHDVKTLYIDDLCVDEACRGQHIGSALYAYVVETARENGCYRITLNVWCLNEPAMRFYSEIRSVAVEGYDGEGTVNT